MQFDLGVIRTVVNPDITEDKHTKHEFHEAGIKFTVLTHHLPGKHLVEFDPEAFMVEEDKNTKPIPQE